MTRPLSDNEVIADTLAWARARIAECQRQEEKFSRGLGTNPRGHGPPQSLIEAWTERRTLEAVVRMLTEGE